MPQELSKATLLAITRAMEDECCASYLGKRNDQ
jgi:hypothetical protein